MKIFFLSVFLTFGLITTAQVDTLKTRQKITAYGYDYNNIGILGSFKPPKDTFRLAIADTGSIAVIGRTAFVWNLNHTLNTLRWDTLAGGSTGTGQNFANANLILTGNRTHTFGSYSETFNGFASPNGFSEYVFSGNAFSASLLNSTRTSELQIAVGGDNSSTTAMLRANGTAESYFQAKADGVATIKGNLLLSDYTSGHTGTVVKYLGVDASGNVLLDEAGVIIDNMWGAGATVFNTHTYDDYYLAKRWRDSLYIKIDSNAYRNTPYLDTTALFPVMRLMFDEAGGGDTLRIAHVGATGVRMMRGSNDTIYSYNMVGSYGSYFTKATDSSNKHWIDTTLIVSRPWLYKTIDSTGLLRSAAGYTGSVQFKSSTGAFDYGPGLWYDKHVVDSGRLWVSGSVFRFPEPTNTLTIADSTGTSSNKGLRIHNYANNGSSAVWYSNGTSISSPTQIFGMGIWNTTTDVFVFGFSNGFGTGALSAAAPLAITQTDQVGIGTTTVSSSHKATALRNVSGTPSTTQGVFAFHATSGSTPLIGFGPHNTYAGYNASSALEDVGRIGWAFTNITSGSENSKLVLSNAQTSTLTEMISFEGGRLTTANATPAVAMTITIPDESAGVLRIVVVGRENTTTGTYNAVWYVSYYKDGGTLTLGTPTAVLAANATGTMAASTAVISASSNNIIVTVTGVAATSIPWKIMAESVYN